MTEPTDKQLPDEQQLDEYLKGDSSVSRQYRQLHGADVPAELDRLVLRQAEDAVKKGPAQGRPAWMRWTAPLAVAASAVLVLSIVIETGVRDETVSEVSSLRVPQPTKSTESKTEETIVSQEAAAPLSMEAPVSPTFAPAAPPPPPVQTETPAPESSASESLMNYQSPVELPRASVQARPTSPPPAAAPAADMAAAGQSVARAADIATRELQSMAIEEAAKKQSAVADEVAREEESSAAVAYSRRVNAQMRAPQPSYSDPEAWLKDIRELRKAGKQDQADREWRRFRIAFPNYEVAEADLAREAKE